MTPGFSVGDMVQTTLGKGVVREIRNNGSLLVLIGSRQVLVDAIAAKTLETSDKSARGRRQSGPDSPLPEHRHPEARQAQTEVDLHGLTVADALVRVESAVNDALLAGHVSLRLIHGRSGGRIKAALHRQLRVMRSVRAFRLDRLNEGVTIVEF